MKITSIILILLFLLSCEDDSNSPSENIPEDGIRDYIPSAIGTYWVYETHEIDEVGNEELIGIDSIVVTGNLNYEGRMAIQCINFQKVIGASNFENLGEFYLSSGNDQLYIHSDGFLNLFSGDFPFGDPADFFELDSEWILIADKNQDRWDAFESDIEFDFFQFEVSGESEAKGRKIQTSILERFDNWNYLLDEFDLNVINDLELNFGLPIGLPIELELDYTIQLADKLGIYSIYSVSSDVEVPNQEVPETPPTIQRLVRTNVR